MKPRASATDAVVLWRCTACGHWSHAHQRPRWHIRYLPEYHHDLDGIPEDHIKWVENGRELDTGAMTYSARFKCGPFEKWSAAPVVAQASRHAERTA